MKFSCSGNLATMAPGLPYAIGAQVAYPDRQVVAFVGDGGFTMLMGDFVTAVKYELPIKVVIIKNNTLGQIKWEQMVFLGNPEYEVELHPIDFVKFAEACGGVGFRCERPEEVRPGAPGGVREQQAGDRRGGGRPVRAADARGGHAAAGAASSPSRWSAASRDAGKIITLGLQGQDQGAGLIRQDDPPDPAPGGVAAMATQTRFRRAVPIDRIDVSAYKVPTDSPESDGTYRVGCDHAWSWSRRPAGGKTGLGYSYADTATARLVRDLLAGVVKGRDAMAVPGAWSAMVAAIRNLGRPGIASMAISAVDAALWDLKARLLDVALVTLLGAVREAAPVYGSGGFTSYSIEQLRDQLGGWAAAGHPAGQDEDRPPSGRRPRPGPGRPRGDRAGRRAVRRRQRGLQPQAGAGHGRGVRRAGRDLVRGAGLLRRPRRAPPAARPRRRPAWTSPPASTATTCSTSAGCSRPARLTCCRPTATRCGGITGYLRAGALCEARGLPFSAHCARRCTPTPAAPCRPSATSSIFHDHDRIEHMFFDGALTPVGGALHPDPGRPGLGLEFKRQDAARYAV